MVANSTLEKTRLTKVLSWLSGILYLASLLSPAYHPVISYAEAGVYYGFAALLLGPIGLFGGHYSWLANPLFWYSWFAIRRTSFPSALAASVVAMIAALSFLAGKTIPVGSSGTFPYEILFGYYVWLCAIALSGSVAIVHIHASRRNAAELPF